MRRRTLSALAPPLVYYRPEPERVPDLRALVLRASPPPPTRLSCRPRGVVPLRSGRLSPGPPLALPPVLFCARRCRTRRNRARFVVAAGGRFGGPIAQPSGGSMYARPLVLTTLAGVFSLVWFPPAVREIREVASPTPARTPRLGRRRGGGFGGGGGGRGGSGGIADDRGRPPTRPRRCPTRPRCRSCRADRPPRIVPDRLHLRPRAASAGAR